MWKKIQSKVWPPLFSTARIWTCGFVYTASALPLSSLLSYDAGLLSPLPVAVFLLTQPTPKTKAHLWASPLCFTDSVPREQMRKLRTCLCRKQDEERGEQRERLGEVEDRTCSLGRVSCCWPWPRWDLEGGSWGLSPHACPTKPPWPNRWHGTFLNHF